MKRRIMSLLLVLILVCTGMLYGCAKGEGTPADESTTEATEAVEATESEGDSNFNATGLPIVNEPVTLKVAARKNENIKKPFEELQSFKDIEAATNVNVEWDVTPIDSWQEKMNLIIASGEWPDVFYGNFILKNEEILPNGKDGVFMPLEDLVDEYAPNVQAVFEQYPKFKGYMTATDGHMYSLPTIDGNFPGASGAQFINKKWLDEVGMEMPTTTDEFYEVLKAFKARCADDEYPMSVRYGQAVSDIHSFAGFFGSFGLIDNSQHLTVKDDTVYYTALQPEYKEAVKYVSKLFAEDLIDIETFSQTMPVYKAKVAESKVGVAHMWSLTWLLGAAAQDSDYVLMPPLEGPNGDKGYLWKSAADMSGKGSFLITTTCEYPEVAMRWADYMCDPEVSFKLAFGPIGMMYSKNADGKYEANQPPEGMSAGEFRHQETAGANSFYMMTQNFLTDNVVPNPGVAEKNGYDEIYAQATGSGEIFPPYFEDPSDAQRAAEIKTDIDIYTRETTAKWFVEGGVEEEWDDFVQTLIDMGAEEYQAIYQKAYDAGNSAE